MVAYLLIAFFVMVAIATGASLADSAVRAANAWRQVRRELALMDAEIPAGAVNIVPMRAAVLATPAFIAQPLRAAAA